MAFIDSSHRGLAALGFFCVRTAVIGASVAIATGAWFTHSPVQAQTQDGLREPDPDMEEFFRRFGISSPKSAGAQSTTNATSSNWISLGASNDKDYGGSELYWLPKDSVQRFGRTLTFDIGVRQSETLFLFRRYWAQCDGSWISQIGVAPGHTGIHKDVISAYANARQRGLDEPDARYFKHDKRRYRLAPLASFRDRMMKTYCSELPPSQKRVAAIIASATPDANGLGEGYILLLNTVSRQGDQVKGNITTLPMRTTTKRDELGEYKDAEFVSGVGSPNIWSLLVNCRTGAYVDGRLNNDTWKRPEVGSVAEGWLIGLCGF